MAKREKSLFWASYADLMTSLFFVMLILFIATMATLKDERRKVEDELTKTKAEQEFLEKIENATKNIDSTYFSYIKAYKKHKLTIDVNYSINDDNIYNLPRNIQDELLQAGRSLREFVERTTSEYSGVQYLLIIEGQASRLGPENINYPLSYKRAYGLKKFWEDKSIRFTAQNCEVLICGSGDGRQSGTGLMRDSTETLNQRFLIHILPKPGHTNEKDNIIVNAADLR